MYSDAGAIALLELMAARRGHFRFVSGHHGSLWLDVNRLFAHPAQIQPFVRALAERLRENDVAAICGAPEGGTILARMVSAELDIPSSASPRGRVAIVDDVINAGTDIRATIRSVRAGARATPVVVGALVTLGESAQALARAEGCALATVATIDHTLWEPDSCPMCAAGIPLESPTG
jgi:orotate phosphoribosyltransferase